MTIAIGLMGSTTLRITKTMAERTAFMKIIVVSSPKVLRRLLAKIFGVELIKK